VLAIGVDNIFLVANRYEQASKALPPAERAAHALARASGSIGLAASAETLAFLLGALTRMPAVQAFALYAGVAVFVDFLLQVRAWGGVCGRVRASSNSVGGGGSRKGERGEEVGVAGGVPGLRYGPWRGAWLEVGAGRLFAAAGCCGTARLNL